MAGVFINSTIDSLVIDFLVNSDYDSAEFK